MNLAARARRETPNDVGTLWTMRRFDRAARCALMERLGDWELRIVVDGTLLVAQRCRRGSEAFDLAERWKHRMLDEGWRSSSRLLRG